MKLIKVSLFGKQERETKPNQIGDALREHMAFAALAEEIDEVAPRPGRERGDRPPFPTKPMVRVLVVQQLYNLSEELMAFRLLDRLSFQRFVGLRRSSQAPERTTIWTFNDRLTKAGASAKIFEAMNRQFERHGYIAWGGRMIDVSIVPVPKQTLIKDGKDIIQQYAMPAEWSPSKRWQTDMPGRSTKNHGKSYLSYKSFGNVDRRRKLICGMHVSTASEHDT
ncbi:transposase [Burkholderia ubonensis]|uniref:transposase n=1 Tax=Burkholderia ubonensis TaxID=101571 RepID=UPI000B223E35|nr:transposase [Burkholderia ubonensis]